MVDYLLNEKNKSMPDQCPLAVEDFSPFLTRLLLVSRTVVNKYYSSLNEQLFTMLLLLLLRRFSLIQVSLLIYFNPQDETQMSVFTPDEGLLCVLGNLGESKKPLK